MSAHQAGTEFNIDASRLGFQTRSIFSMAALAGRSGEWKSRDITFLEQFFLWRLESRTNSSSCLIIFDRMIQHKYVLLVLVFCFLYSS